MLRIDPELEANQRVSLDAVREQRDSTAVDTALEAVSTAASGHDNLLYPMKAALEAGATIGEITATLVPIFGRYRPAF